MKTSIVIATLALSVSLGFSACNNSVQKTATEESAVAKAEVYTCSMHPEVESDKPGDCPKCGMALIKKEAADTTQMQPGADTTHMK